MSAKITDVPGLLVGHHTDLEVRTGCTVVLPEHGGMRGGVYVRGRATGTRELDALSPRHLVPQIHALLLTGGSAFGLGAADGVMRWLAERRRGFDVGVGVVPIVPAAVIFDLAVGTVAWPSAQDGYRACDAATVEVGEGAVGAGTGAMVGKVMGGGQASRGGLGTWAVRRGDVVVGALAVVNAFGDVRNARGEIVAGARGPEGFADTRRLLTEGAVPGGSFARQGANTTLVVVATNAALDQVELSSVAVMAGDALGQRITPVGTEFDGDIVFAVSHGASQCRSLLVELLAQEAVATAIERAVTDRR